MGIDENIVASVCVQVEGYTSWEHFIIDTLDLCSGINAFLGFSIIEMLIAGSIGVTKNHVRLAIFCLCWRWAKDVRSAILQELHEKVDKPFK